MGTCPCGKICVSNPPATFQGLRVGNAEHVVLAQNWATLRYSTHGPTKSHDFVLKIIINSRSWEFGVIQTSILLGQLFPISGSCLNKIKKHPRSQFVRPIRSLQFILWPKKIPKTTQISRFVLKIGRNTITNNNTIADYCRWLQENSSQQQRYSPSKKKTLGHRRHHPASLAP